MKLKINKEGCKGCSLCVEFCPKKVLSLGKETNAKGYNFVKESEIGCIFCGSCAVMCPDTAIEIEET